MTWQESAKLIASHTPTAGAMALIFTAGALAAPTVLRRQLRPLLVVPAWFARMLAAVLDRHPSRFKLALFIFGFNGAAIFVYMMTGLLPIFPALMAFSTGLNVVLASLIGRKPFAPSAASPPTRSAILCGLLTFMIELPCFWYSMAMGWSMSPKLLALIRGAEAAPILKPISAYLAIVLPALAVSAIAEAHAVVSTRT